MTLLRLFILGFVAVSLAESSKFQGAQSNLTAARATKGDLLSYFSRISGSNTISGQHNREPNSDPARWTGTVRDITGKYPGLWGGDFLFLPDDVRNRQPMITEAIRQWNAGSVVALTWHVCPPTVGETCNWDANGILSHMNDNQWNDLVTEGGNLNRAWKQRIDTIVPFLRQLNDAGVIAIWRPIHEMNEGWSWWGGRPGANGSRKLYQLTHDYMVNTQGLNNLVWTWCVKDVEMNSIGQYWPGANYVDVSSLDLWMNMQARDDHYQQMLAVSEGKPIALAEVGSVPSPAVLERQNRWIWFMVWAEYLKDPAYNSDQSVQNTYYHPRVLSQGNIDIPGGGDGNLAQGKSIRASSQQDATLPPSNANDGNFNSRWASNLEDQQWIIVDLGSAQNIRQVKLFWEDAFATGYQIQTSNNDETWTTVHENYNGSGGSVTINIPTTNARYVKMYAFQRATEYGYSLYEFEVYA